MNDGFTCLLRSISRSQEVIAAATVFKARCGRRRPYLSESSALAYEAGFANWPNVPAGPVGSPAFDGYMDAEQQDADAREYEAMRAEERASQ